MQCNPMSLKMPSSRRFLPTNRDRYHCDNNDRHDSNQKDKHEESHNDSGNSEPVKLHPTFGRSCNFPNKLFDLMEYATWKDANNLVTWSTDGLSFDIWDTDEFMHELGSKFFPQQASFRALERQLNNWGFVRQRQSTLKWQSQSPSQSRSKLQLQVQLQVQSQLHSSLLSSTSKNIKCTSNCKKRRRPIRFYHPLFQRDQPNLKRYIHRSSLPKTSVSPKSSCPTSTGSTNCTGCCSNSLATTFVSLPMPFRVPLSGMGHGRRLEFTTRKRRTKDNYSDNDNDSDSEDEESYNLLEDHTIARKESLGCLLCRNCKDL